MVTCQTGHMCALSNSHNTLGHIIIAIIIMIYYHLITLVYICSLVNQQLGSLSVTTSAGC